MRLLLRIADVGTTLCEAALQLQGLDVAGMKRSEQVVIVIDRAMSSWEVML